jgi:hypothetical protein
MTALVNAFCDKTVTPTAVGQGFVFFPDLNRHQFGFEGEEARTL